MLFLMWIRKNHVIANDDVLYQSLDCLRTHLYDARSWEVSVAFHIFNMEVSCSKSRCCLYHQQIFSWSMSQLISFGCWFRFHYLSTIISMHYTTLEIIIQDYWTSIEEAPQSRCLFFSRNLFHIKNSPSFHIPRGSISRPAPQEMLRCRSADLVAHELLVASLASGTAGTMGLLGLPRAGSLRFCQTFSESKGVENARMTFGGWSSVKESEDWYTKAEDSILRSWVKVSACFNNLLIYGILILMSL